MQKSSLPIYSLVIFLITMSSLSLDGQKRVRDYGIEIGVLKVGIKNAITDVKGVKVGHTTIIKDNNIRTGATAIVPHEGNIFQEKVPAAIYLGNGFGKLAGYSQVKELGNLETPIILTNTLSVANAMNGVITYTLSEPENADVRSVNAVVGENNDGRLNDIQGRHVSEDHILSAIHSASTENTAEGNVGAGTGTICFGWKGGIGTSSRVIPSSMGGYTVGVMVQSNFGGVFELAGVPVGKLMGKYPYKRQIEADSDGSCMIVVATDAPLSPRNLERLAKRAMLGLGKTGGIASNGSGDYVIAFSTYEGNRIPYRVSDSEMKITDLHNDRLTPLFLAAIEATQEAIYNSLFAAQTMEGANGNKVESIPIDEVLKIVSSFKNGK